MKTNNFLWVALVTLVLLAQPAAAQQASVAMGKKLFADPGLGASKNTISCNTCHEDGGGMERAAANPQLGAMINRCIKGPLQGEGLSEKTVAMESLQLYLKSLSK